MRVAEGGGTGAPGHLRQEIADAAIRAELEHEGWRPLGDDRLEYRVLGTAGAGPAPAAADLRFDPATGTYEYGHGGVSVTADYEAIKARADAVMAKWPGKIDDLFAPWIGLPSGFEGRAAERALCFAAGELLIDPDNLEQSSNQPSEANGRLAGDLHRLMTEPGRMNLAGQYARNFFRYYVDDLPTAIESLGQVLAALCAAVATQGEIWQRTEASLIDLEYKALYAMRDAGPRGGGTDWAAILTVGGALVAGLAAAPALGAAGAFATAMVGSTLSAGGAVAGAFDAAESARPHAERYVAAGHPHEVFSRMTEALSDLNDLIIQQEEGVQSLLTAAETVVTGGACRIGRRGGSVEHEPGVRVDADTVGIITRMWLPSVADDVRRAERGLTVTVRDGFHRAGDVGLGADGAWPVFSNVQPAASRLLSKLARDLEDGADKLHQAARTIGSTNHQIDTWYRREQRRVEDQNINDSDGVRTRP